MRVGIGMLGVLAFGCGDDTEERVAAITALTGDPVAGEAVWQAECAGCHDDPAEFSAIPAAGQARVILTGAGSMPPLDDLPDQDIADVVAYVLDSAP